MDKESDELSSLYWYFTNGFEGEDDSEQQEIGQFVKRVEAFSSQYGTDTSVSYIAFNLQGPPSNFPDYGDFPQSFVMRTYGTWWDEAPSRREDFMKQNNRNIPSHDFIEVSFERPVYPISLRIFETYNPGAVVRVWAYASDYWALLWEGDLEKVEHVPRMFSPQLRKVDFATSVMRIEFNHSMLYYYTELDAVHLIGKKLETSKESPGKNKFSSSSSFKSNKRPVIEKGVLMNKILSSNLHEVLVAPTGNDVTENYSDAPESLLGYFAGLPDETVLYILKFLDLRSLLSCAQINRHFNRLSTDPILYKTLNLKPYWHCVDSQFMASLSRRCQLLRKLDLSWCGGHDMIGPHTFMSFLKDCNEGLTHLRLDSCEFVNCQVLTALVLKAPYLQEISLSGCVNVQEFLPVAVLTNLTSLNLYRTAVRTDEVLTIVYSNSKLQHLNLGSCSNVENMDEVAILLGTNCPDLVSVDFWKSSSLTPLGIRALSKCHNLQEIDVGWCLHLSASGEWLSCLSSCKQLKKLFLEALRGVCDRDLRTLIQNTPKIEQLDLLGVRSISADVCVMILSECHHLRLLDVSFCDQINELQVEKWRKQYPQVSIKRPTARTNPNEVTPLMFLPAGDNLV